MQVHHRHDSRHVCSRHWDNTVQRHKNNVHVKATTKNYNYKKNYKNYIKSILLSELRTERGARRMPIQTVSIFYEKVIVMYFLYV
jgi:hypothetical protein